MVVYQQMGEIPRVFSSKWYQRVGYDEGETRYKRGTAEGYKMRSERLMLQAEKLSERVGREKHRRLMSLFEVFRTPLEGKRVMEGFEAPSGGDQNRRTTLVERLDSLEFRDNRRVRRPE